MSMVRGDGSGASTTRSEESIRRIDLVDVIHTVLYEDLKREFFYSDQGLDRVKRLIRYVSQNRQRFMTPRGVYAIWLTLSRLESHTFWRSLPYLSVLTEKRSQLRELKKKFDEEVFNFSTQGANPQSFTFRHGSDGAPRVDFGTLQREKERAERDAEDHQRLKLADICKRLFHPFDGPG